MLCLADILNHPIELLLAIRKNLQLIRETEQGTVRHQVHPNHIPVLLNHRVPSHRYKFFFL